MFDRIQIVDYHELFLCSLIAEGSAILNLHLQQDSSADEAMPHVSNRKMINCCVWESAVVGSAADAGTYPAIEACTWRSRACKRFERVHPQSDVAQQRSATAFKSVAWLC